ncbi:MAG: DUF2961 domain-containing protein [Chthonomonadales bacterium]
MNNPMMGAWMLVLCTTSALAASCSQVPGGDGSALWTVPHGSTGMVNALWGENPPAKQFGGGRTRVVIADLKGPAVITMIHFALPQTLHLDRHTVLRIWWDGEKAPSVEVPLVDFFCDPDGALDRVNSIFVNKKRGWNCYFPMPFRKSARVEVDAEDPRYPNGIASREPCYAYVHYRTMLRMPADVPTFHATWRQQTVDMDRVEFRAMEAEGKGVLVGWNLTVRGVRARHSGYLVDENVKIWVDGARQPAIEWQGLEDAFGFSWGFPEQANSFPRTGYQPWYDGAAAYRFLVEDRVVFRKALRITVGFGRNEVKSWRAMFPQGFPPHQFSAVTYWYQTEPHRPYPALPPSHSREPQNLAVPLEGPVDAGDALELACGSSKGDLTFARQGWDFILNRGYTFEGPPWTSPVKHCWADYRAVQFTLLCPQKAEGVLRLYLLDGDNFGGGRHEALYVNGRFIGEYGGFQQGRWVEVPVTSQDTASGQIHVTIKNLKPGSNAVVTYVRFRTNLDQAGSARTGPGIR